MNCGAGSDSFPIYIFCVLNYIFLVIFLFFSPIGNLQWHVFGLLEQKAWIIISFLCLIVHQLAKNSERTDILYLLISFHHFLFSYNLSSGNFYVLWLLPAKFCWYFFCNWKSAVVCAWIVFFCCFQVFSVDFFFCLCFLQSLQNGKMYWYLFFLILNFLSIHLTLKKKKAGYRVGIS